MKRWVNLREMQTKTILGVTPLDVRGERVSYATDGSLNWPSEMQFWQSLLKKIKSAHPETDLVGLVAISPREALHMFAQGGVHTNAYGVISIYQSPPKTGMLVLALTSGLQNTRLLVFADFLLQPVPPIASFKLLGEVSKPRKRGAALGSWVQANCKTPRPPTEHVNRFCTGKKTQHLHST